MNTKRLNNFISDLKEIEKEKNNISLTLQLIDAGLKGDEKLFDDISDKFSSDIKYIRALERIANNIGINHSKFDNRPTYEFEREIIKTLKSLPANSLL